MSEDLGSDDRLTGFVSRRKITPTEKECLARLKAEEDRIWANQDPDAWEVQLAATDAKRMHVARLILDGVAVGTVARLSGCSPLKAEVLALRLKVKQLLKDP